jgi:hypothetical protein
MMALALAAGWAQHHVKCPPSNESREAHAGRVYAIGQFLLRLIRDLDELMGANENFLLGTYSRIRRFPAVPHAQKSVRLL